MQQSSLCGVKARWGWFWLFQYNLPINCYKLPINTGILLCIKGTKYSLEN